MCELPTAVAPPHIIDLTVVRNSVVWNSLTDSLLRLHLVVGMGDRAVLLISLHIHHLWSISWLSCVMVIATLCRHPCFLSDWRHDVLIHIILWLTWFIIRIKIAWINAFFFLYKVLNHEMILYFLLIKSQNLTLVLCWKLHFWFESLLILRLFLLLIIYKIILFLIQILSFIRVSWKVIWWGCKWFIFFNNIKVWFSFMYDYRRWCWWTFWTTTVILIQIKIYFFIGPTYVFQFFFFLDELLSFIFLIFLLIWCFLICIIWFAAFTEKEAFLLIVLLFLQNFIRIHWQINNLSLLFYFLILILFNVI